MKATAQTAEPRWMHATPELPAAHGAMAPGVACLTRGGRLLSRAPCAIHRSCLCDKMELELALPRRPPRATSPRACKADRRLSRRLERAAMWSGDSDLPVHSSSRLLLRNSKASQRQSALTHTRHPALSFSTSRLRIEGRARGVGVRRGAIRP